MNEHVERVSACLTELIKAALVSDDARSVECRAAARRSLDGLADAPPEAGSVKIDGAWTSAVKAAEAPDLIPQEGRVSLTLPQACPFTLDELLAPAFDVDAAVERIAHSAATG